MFEVDIRVIRDGWSDGTVEMPKPFMLIGRGGPNVLGGEGGQGPLVVDAEGVQLRSGAVYTWCRSGCCAEQPRYWSSAADAADFHGAYILDGDGTVRAAGGDA